MVSMYHSFLIHLSTDGHIGCFHALAITNSAVMNIEVHMSLSDLVSSCVCPEVVLLGHMAVLFPVFYYLYTFYKWLLFPFHTQFVYILNRYIDM